MMNKNADNEALDKRGATTSFRDIPLVSIIIFMVSLMTAAIINTQAEMKPIANVLAFLALGCLIIGIAAQLIRMRK